MEDKELTKDYLHNRLQNEISNIRMLYNSCTMSTIRWLQRYSHCYSIICSFICFPLWILILPIAFIFDIFIYTIVFILFIFTFIIYILFAPCNLAYKFSSCSDAWNPINIYRYSLTEALLWSHTTFMFFNVIWSCYCGTGDIENGVPICCIYCCGAKCHQACNYATHIDINDRPCTIL